MKINKEHFFFTSITVDVPLFIIIIIIISSNKFKGLPSGEIHTKFTVMRMLIGIKYESVSHR